MGSCRRHTVEDRALEETQELEEQVLLLGHDLVETELLATRLDIGVSDTLLDVGLEPVVWDDAIAFCGVLLGGLPELVVVSVWRELCRFELVPTNLP